MEPFRNALPLGDAELERLEDLLASEIFRGEAMRLDELQGLLCAVVSAPEPVLPSAWMPAALGEEPVYENETQAQEVIDLLMRLYNEVAAVLYRGEEPELILYPADVDSDESDYGAWADGYLYGTHLGNVDWLDAAGEYAEDLSDLLENLFLLNGALKDMASASFHADTPSIGGRFVLHDRKPNMAYVDGHVAPMDHSQVAKLEKTSTSESRLLLDPYYK